MDYDFERDPTKARSNRAKHGVAFEEAATVFSDPRVLSAPDPDHSEADERWITLGISGLGRLLVVCHTFLERPGEGITIRIYSSRKAIRKETRTYEGSP